MIAAFHMFLRSATALAVLGLGVAAAGAAPSTSRLTYTVSISGLPVAEGDLVLVEAGRRYDMSVDWRTAGLANVFAAARGAIHAGGRLGERRVNAERYRLTGSNGKVAVDVALGLSGGRVRSAAVSPATQPSGDLVPLTPEHKRDVIDPLSAVLAPVKGAPEEICGRTLAIFDGWSRYDVRLSPKTVRSSAPEGFSGGTVVCSMRWVPVAGHRTRHNATRYMADNTDMEIAFGRLEGRDLWIPVDVSVGTMIGTARVSVGTAAVAAPVAAARKRSRIRS